jgi:hypothetical protein
MALRDDIAVWILAGIITLTLSSVILYVEPSFPLTVLGVYIIEVLMFANLFLNNKKYKEFSPPKMIEKAKIFQLEKDD